MSFAEITVIFLIFLAVGIPVTVAAFSYKKKVRKVLTPAAYDARMRELENERLNEIALAGSQEMLDQINKRYDEVFSEYKIRR